MLSYVLQAYATMVGGSIKVREVLDTVPKINTEGGNKLDEDYSQTTLEVIDARFSYPGKPDAEVLKGVSFKVSSDYPRVVALCGPSGCGKSSVISLIERFYDPDDGKVFYNGHDIRELEPKWYH